MTQRVARGICIGLVLLILIAIVCLYPYRKKATVSTEKIAVSDCFVAANNAQFEASVWMGVYRQMLYFYPHCAYTLRRTAYDGWLCVFQDQKIVKLKELEEVGSDVHIVGYADGFLYYVRYGKKLDADDILYCYNLNTNQENMLYSGSFFSRWSTISISSDGTLTVPLRDGEPSRFLQVLRGELRGVSNQPKSYDLSGRKSVSVATYNDDVERIILTDEEGNSTELPLALASRRSLIPSANGLLIHNEEYQTLLYYVNNLGTVLPLFETVCVSSNSAVTIVGDKAYLSLRRYERFASLGMHRFDNDTVEGMYQINLQDLSMEKISEHIYNGIYYFGEEYLYACDQSCNIYLLDMQGNRISTIFEVNL